MVAKKIYLFANWKMYLNLKESEKLSGGFKKQSKKLSSKVEMAIFPSALSYFAVNNILHGSDVDLGAQNIHWEDKGGFTGEISAQMFKGLGAKYALVGHSERRHLFHETNHEINKKMEAALSVGLVPVLCVGETSQERDGGKAKEVVEIQLRAALHDLHWFKKTKLIVAYEPVWAVGTGIHCEPIEAQTMSALIKKITNLLLPEIETVVLYGGSVDGNNIKQFIEQSDIQGVLVGGASTKLDSWLKIVHNAC